MIDEEWRAVTAAPDYEVSNTGRVRRITAYRSTAPGREVRPDVHPRVRLFVKGKPRTFQVHRVVAQAFHGDPPSPKHVAAHRNGDPLDNAASNLRWATHTENAQDRIAHGTALFGDKNPKQHLTDLQVRLIRAHYAHGQRKAVIARLFQTTDTHVHRIVTGAARVSAGGYL